MLTSTSILFLIALLLIATILKPLARKFRIPFSIVLILLGFSGSEIVTNVLLIDTGIRCDNFNLIILKIFLPVIIFQAALKLDVRILLRDIVPLVLLALPLMLVAVFITAAILYYGIGYPEVFSWHTAILCGALLSATDPASVVSILKRLNVSERVSTLLESESLFNDATAVVLFMLLVSMRIDTASVTEWQDAVFSFANVFSGGILVGVLSSLIVYLILKFIDGPYVYTLVTLIAVYGAFIIAGDFLGCSGVMAVLTLGVIMTELPALEQRRDSVSFTESFWQFIALVVDNLIYLLAGLTITFTMFQEQWLAMILGVLAVLIARAVIVMILLPAFCFIFRIEKITGPQLMILNWGGVRGTVTLALALSLPLSLESWFTVQSIAYGVVLFTLFVQLSSMSPLVSRLRLGEEQRK